jgi:sulfonate dioxygenase
LIAGIGSYKEFSPIGYEKKAEEKGRDGFEPAKVDNIRSIANLMCYNLVTSDAIQYPHYLPTWNPEQNYPQLKSFKHVEHGLDTDSNFPAIIREGVTVTHLTPTIGTEVVGVQLSSLDATGKDQLTRLVAKRKVVTFRDQDFADLPISKALEFGGYFGRHHIHPTFGSPERYPEIHLAHCSAGDKTIDKFLENRTSSVAWHSDVSYEEQPPGTTFLYILDKPETGGDAIFVNQTEAYNKAEPSILAKVERPQSFTFRC